MGTRRRSLRSSRIAVAGLLVAAGLAACTASSAREPAGPRATPSGEVAGGPAGRYLVPPGIHKIKHVIIVMQENRSFDSYFGTYPGATGIPVRHGVPAVCVPDPAGGCTRPYRDRADVNGGRPPRGAHPGADVHGGRVDGLIPQRRAAPPTCQAPHTPAPV